MAPPYRGSFKAKNNKDSKIPILEVYTDGGCNNKTGRGAWAYVVVKNNQPIFAKSQYDGCTTSNRMEITAVMQCLIWFKSSKFKSHKLLIRSDSQYVVNCINLWIDGWAKRDWVKGRGEEVKNKDLWKDVFVLKNKLQFKIKWVKGHAGNHYNEIADSLCTEQMKINR